MLATEVRVFGDVLFIGVTYLLLCVVTDYLPNGRLGEFIWFGGFLAWFLVTMLLVSGLVTFGWAGFWAAIILAVVMAVMIWMNPRCEVRDDS